MLHYFSSTYKINRILSIFTPVLAFYTLLIILQCTLSNFFKAIFMRIMCISLQVWQATSIYSLSDYTGEYKLELVPCTAPPEEAYVASEPPACTPQPPQAFTLPLAIQQSHRPVPLVYTLNTVFQLLSTPDLFLQDPRKVDNLQVKVFNDFNINLVYKKS